MILWKIRNTSNLWAVVLTEDLISSYLSFQCLVFNHLIHRTWNSMIKWGIYCFLSSNQIVLIWKGSLRSAKMYTLLRRGASALEGHTQSQASIRNLVSNVSGWELSDFDVCMWELGLGICGLGDASFYKEIGMNRDVQVQHRDVLHALDPSTGEQRQASRSLRSSLAE